MPLVASTKWHDENTQGAVRPYASVYLKSSSGSTNGNYGSHLTNENWEYAPSARSTMRVMRMLVTIEDTSGIAQDEYGNLGASLTSGILVRTADSSGATILDLLDGGAIRTNADWSRYCYDVQLHSWTASPTNEMVSVRWTFDKAGVPIRLEGGKSESIQVRLRDNLTGLVTHNFIVQGYFEEDST